MAGSVDEHLQKAAECATNLDNLRTDAEFREGDVEKQLRLAQASVYGIEALYHQSLAIIELLRSSAKGG